MLNRLEMILYKILFWGLVPLILFLLGWWLSLGLVEEQRISSVAFAGMGVGILIDVFFLKPVLKSLETIKPMNLMLIFVFYSIMTLGFFMGVPIFNLALGILAARFMIRVGLYQDLSETKMEIMIQNTAKFVTVVLVGVCIISALIALKDPADTAINIQLMLNLGFEVTPLMIYGLILFGGLILIFLQYRLAIYFAHYNLKHVHFDPKDPFYRPIS